MQMRSRALSAIALIFLAGCGGRADVSSYSAVYREVIKAMQDLTEQLSSVKDEATMKAAGTELKKRFHLYEQVTKKAQALPKPSDEVKRQIEEELHPQQALDNYRKEVRRIMGLPGGKDFLEEMGNLR
jgi:hypothetical protein